MYQRRLTILLLATIALTAVVIARLAQIQLIQGPDHARRAEHARFLPARLLNTVRGDLVDRNGHILATDAADFELCLRYDTIRLFDPRWTAARLRAEAQRANARRNDPNQAVQRLAQRLQDQRAQAAQLLDRVADHLAALSDDTDPTAQPPQGPNSPPPADQRIRTAIDYVAQTIWHQKENYARHRFLNGQPSTKTWAQLLPDPDQRDDKALAAIVRTEKQWHPVLDQLTQPEAISLHHRFADVDLLTVRPSRQRRYPYDDVAAHIIGYTSRFEPNDDDPLAQDELAQLNPGDWIGRTGIEALLEQPLRGRRGMALADRDGDIHYYERPRFGERISLTIDIDLQHDLQGLLADRPGAIVVIDVNSAELLAMVSSPTYSLAKLREDYHHLVSDPSRPLLHRAAVGIYPPGSTVKPIVLLAALAENLVTPDERIRCGGALDPDDLTKYKCWISRFHRTSHQVEPGIYEEAVNALEAIQCSCNVYFYKLGARLGTGRLAARLSAFGFGRAAGTGLEPDDVGLMPTRPDQLVSVAVARNLAVGQALAATPLQVANAYATIARRGLWRPVRIVQPPHDPPQTRDPDRRVGGTPEHWALIAEALRRVVNHPRGTAFNRATLPDLQIAGKTGTAQTGKPDEPDHAWFAGYAPADRPAVAFAILVEHGGAGGQNAATLAPQIIQLCRHRGYIDRL